MKLEPGSEENLIVLVIEVKEKSTGVLGGGGGYSSGEGLFAYASIKESNLFGRGQSIEAKLEVGTRTTYILSFYEPWLGNTPTFLAWMFMIPSWKYPRKINGLILNMKWNEWVVNLLSAEIKENFKIGLELKTEEATYTLISRSVTR